ncbi:hypothetical protein [Nocardia higoensis]|nr:hypothetical protein [Nocardia higoensis]
MLLDDRRDAGHRLAGRLEYLRGEDGIATGAPAGDDRTGSMPGTRS